MTKQDITSIGLFYKEMGISCRVSDCEELGGIDQGIKKRNTFIS